MKNGTKFVLLLFLPCLYMDNLNDVLYCVKDDKVIYWIKNTKLKDRFESNKGIKDFYKESYNV